jgi:signal transduction histidine kinase
MNDRGKGRAEHRRILLLSLVAALPVVVALALAAIGLTQSAGRPRLPCPLYPSAVVAVAAELHEDCPLEPGDTILGIEVDGRTEAIDSGRELAGFLVDRVPMRLVVRRPGEPTDRRVWVDSATTPITTDLLHLAASMLLAGLLLSFVLLTAVRSGAPAGVPFALIHSCLAVLIVAAVAGWTTTLSYPLTALARAILPASLIHLAFVFPRTREVAIRVPGIRRVGYFIALGFFLLELSSAFRGSFSTTLLLQRISMAASAVALTLLCFGSWLSIRESPSRLEKGQAKVFLSGLAILLSAMVGLSGTDVPGGLLSAVTLGVALSLLPLGYAIARYHLFDFDAALRRTVSYGLYLSIWSGLFFVGVVLLRDRLPIPEWLRNPVVLYAGVCTVLAPIDGVRHLLKRFIERAFQPEPKTWAHLSEGRASRLAHLLDAESVARTAVDLAADGVANAGVSLFLGDRSGLRLAHARGSTACRNPDVASMALHVATGSDVIDLNRVDTIEPEAAALWDAGIEVVAVIATSSLVHGVLLVAPVRRGKLHPSNRLTWLRLVGAHAAAAFDNVRLSEQLRVSEEFATRGRMHAELAHEIGKPLGALEILAQRLAAETDSSPSLHQRATSIARIAGQLRDIVRGVLDAGRSLDRIEVSDLIERACLEIASVHGPGAVCVLPIPPLPTLDRRADRTVRALTNLIDNAIRASPPGEGVEIGARPVIGAVEIEIVDRGCGIAPDDLERVFDAFVTMREGGNGLGLTISRQIVEQLGGTLVLESAPGQGTRARLRLPTADAS